MTTIWALEQGEYSDYRIIGVFSTEENARRIKNLTDSKWDIAEIVEWEIDPFIDNLNAGKMVYSVAMRRDGLVENVKCEWHEYECSDGVLYLETIDGANARVLHTFMWATDEQHAIKIANERRIKKIASGEWQP